MSGFTSFLKKLGTVIVNGAGIAAGIGPIINNILGSAGASQKVTNAVAIGVNDLTTMGQTVAQIEVVGTAVGLTGAQKLAAATPLLASIIKTSELISGKTIANDAQFIAGVQQMNNGLVAILNSLHPNGVQQTGPAIMPPTPPAAPTA